IKKIIEKKYTSYIGSFWRQRAEPVKEYLKNSTHESGDNRLAYILSSGQHQDGALNIALIEGLTPLMLQEHPIPSIDIAIRDKSFKEGIADFTKDVVFFAKKDKRFTHAYSDSGMSLLYKAIYDWVDTLTEKSFKSLISSTLKQYELGLSGLSGFLGRSRRKEVEGYLDGNTHAKALAMIFMNGLDSSSLSECLFVKIIQNIKKEINKYPELLQDQKYKLVQHFNLAEHQLFYLSNIKHHPETIIASHHQLKIPNELTY
ncbi:MAG: hypothetical protein HYX60_01375, partial [Legionella longbeachae]|nr:hypothetical protein [Legionella longbeachae]